MSRAAQITLSDPTKIIFYEMVDVVHSTCMQFIALFIVLCNFIVISCC